MDNIQYKNDKISIVKYNNGNQSSVCKWYINQCGYDSFNSKRATISNGEEHCVFSLVESTSNKVVFRGNICNQIADFSDFTGSGSFYLKYGDIRSSIFKIKPNRILDVSLGNALAFMEQARQDAFETGGNTGYAWRDSHQFSFELNSLVMLYMANPSYWNSLPHGVYKVAQCEYTELRTQNEPDIVWLMKFAVTRYYKWATEKNITLHALIKGQLSYFLYIYPFIQDYVDESFYQTIRDFTINCWSVTTCNKSWYEVDGGINHNLFLTQSKVGGVKGSLPPGYAIVPNLMMYEVAKRDNLSNADDFKTAAINNINWMVNTMDIVQTQYTKGQRMNEYMVYHSLTYAYKMYKELCPTSTYSLLSKLASSIISRSYNMWDYAEYSKVADMTEASTEVWCNLETSGGLCQQQGNVGGLLAVCLSLCQIIDNRSIVDRLRQIGFSAVDHMFGRNPLGRHFDYKAVEEFDGATLGWSSRYAGGYGKLDNVVGVLDGSPKNENYPFNPSGDTGYNEGWVAFNTAWNMSLAYLLGESNSTDAIGIFSKC